MPHKIKTFQSPTHKQETTQLRPKSHKKPPSTKSTRSNSATNLQKIIIPAESATGNDGDRQKNKPIKNPEWGDDKESVNQWKRKKGKRSKSGAALERRAGRWPQRWDGSVEEGVLSCRRRQKCCHLFFGQLSWQSFLKSFYFISCYGISDPSMWLSWRADLELLLPLSPVSISWSYRFYLSSRINFNFMYNPS